jgi:crotonobetainyl-CoA:carnitine CoA-transferase CaiB-like acyl-CoA transferase
MPPRTAPLPILAGLTVATSADAELPARTCAEHLTRLGACLAVGRHRSLSEIGPGTVGRLVIHAPEDDALDCTIRWDGVAQREGTEAIVQALAGLMTVHGRDAGRPRRLGLDVASVAAGIVATQGVLAALVARLRGQAASTVETSVLQAGLLFVCHHLAIATCGDAFPLAASEPAPGPPFRTADGHWVELEALSGDAWVAFWRRLGLEPAELAGRAWLPFVYRYLAGRCSLPSALHAATSRYTLAQLRSVAEACGVALCRVRTYSELLTESVVDDLGTPWRIVPGMRRSAGVDRHPTRPAGGPLSGMRVVEVTSRLQGPLAGLLLQLLGAEVVKVEPPGGDFGRISPPLAGSVGAAYLAYNRGKHVVEIDYKQPHGQAELADLAANADVFMHNWPAGRAETLGFDAERLTRANRGLVYAHASGWGSFGRGPSQIAGDFLVQAHAACGDGLNPLDEQPFPSRLTLVDVTGGLLACEGVLAALYLRERTGKGCRVETSLLGAASALQAEVLRDAATGREPGRRLGRPCWGVLDRPLETADGFLVVAVAGERDRRRLSEALSLRPSSNGGPPDALIAKRLRGRSAAEWELMLRDAGIPATAVHGELASMTGDPRVAGLLEAVDGPCWVPAPPWHFTP